MDGAFIFKIGFNSKILMNFYMILINFIQLFEIHTKQYFYQIKQQKIKLNVKIVKKKR